MSLAVECEECKLSGIIFRVLKAGLYFPSPCFKGDRLKLLTETLASEEHMETPDKGFLPMCAGSGVCCLGQHIRKQSLSSSRRPTGKSFWREESKLTSFMNKNAHKSIRAASEMANGNRRKRSRFPLCSCGDLSLCRP